MSTKALPAACETACSPVEAAFAEVETPLDELRARAAAKPVAVGRTAVVVCHRDALPRGAKQIVESRGISVGVYNIDDAFYAIKNVCPHYGAPLCRGHLHATHRPSDADQFEPTLDGRVVRCPWHGWEFDVITGKALYDRKSRVATYKVECNEAGEVVVYL